MLDELDMKLIEWRNWNACDSNTQGGLSNSLLILRELGIKAAPAAKKPTLTEYLNTKPVAALIAAAGPTRKR